MSASSKTMSLIIQATLISRRFCSQVPSITNILRPPRCIIVPSTSLANSNYKTLVHLTPSARHIHSIPYNRNTAASGVKPVVSNDRPGEDYERETVYTAILSKRIRFMKIFSLLTSGIGLAMQPLLYFKVQTESTGSSLTIPLCTLIGMLALTTPVLMHIITKKYVINIDWVPKEDKYIATTYNFIGMKKHIEFTPEDITIPTVLGAFTTCAIKQINVFIDANQFKDPNHYIRIMGYDKPIDITDNAIDDDDDDDDDDPNPNPHHHHHDHHQHNDDINIKKK